MKVWLKGLMTGLILQVAIGPVFFYIINQSLRRSPIYGLASVMAVTLVDFFYIALAILGVGRLFENEKIKKQLGLLGAIVLMAFGFYMLYQLMFITTPIQDGETMNTLFGSFVSAFILTISSPLTIVFWTSVFATRAIEYNLSKIDMRWFGLGAGTATPLFLGSAVIMTSQIGAYIPQKAVFLGNLSVSIMLLVYGFIRFLSIIRLSLATDQ